MKIIITEEQFDKTKDLIDQQVKKFGISNTAMNLLSMSVDKFIEMFGFKLNDEKIINLIDHYMENIFDNNFNHLNPPNKWCRLPMESFLNMVVTTINNYIYNHKIFDELPYDEDDSEFEDLFYLIEHYIKNKYGEKIAQKYIDNCS